MADILVILYPQEPYNVLYGRRVLYNTSGTDAQNLGIQPETNVHFIGRYQPPQYRYLQSQRENPALDLPPAVQPPEAPSQPFVVLYDYQTYNVVKPSRLYYTQQDVPFQPPPVATPETNTHFVGKFDQGGYSFFVGAQDATPNPVATAQPETNTHFIGRYSVAKYNLPNYFAPDVPFQPPPPVAETNVHFIGKYQPPAYARPINSWDTSVSGPLPTQPETNVHFIGRYNAGRLARWIGAFSAPEFDPPPALATVSLDLAEVISVFPQTASGVMTANPVDTVGTMSATFDRSELLSQFPQTTQGTMTSNPITIQGRFP